MPSTPMSAERADAPLLAGRYRWESVIGRGSMGTVWIAYDDMVHRRVAIKEINIPPGLPHAEETALVQRTMREARAIGGLSHPNVITLYDIVVDANRPYIVMELLRAQSMADLLKQRGPLPDSIAATIGVAVSGALQAAHRNGVTHRDVKPGNVLIGQDGRMKLTDFGIARSEHDPAMTITGMLLGSPAYIAPEVASGAPASPAADAWGLGALLFTAVEGQPPFDRRDPIPTLTSIVADPVPPHPNSGSIGDVIDGLLHKDPAQRMTVDQALQALRPSASDPTGLDCGQISGDLPSAITQQMPIVSKPTGRAVSSIEIGGVVSSGRAATAVPTGRTASAVPPPPWSNDEAAALAPLPTADAEPDPASATSHPRWLLPLAVLLAALMAVGAYFLMDAIAQWASRSAG